MNERQMPKDEAVKFFSDFYFGEHHLPSEIKSCGYGWSVTDTSGDLATFDFD